MNTLMLGIPRDPDDAQLDDLVDVAWPQHHRAISAQVLRRAVLPQPPPGASALVERQVPCALGVEQEDGVRVVVDWHPGLLVGRSHHSPSGHPALAAINLPSTCDTH
ncbi:hypothetical protein AB0C04_21060 [Micromonospora sp. NPDC048909]|uniref:hypothetical protein n=1 Tax=Micromonospora sp. NPDC048909 TaxID=3155643 RepID=UPI0033D5246B